MSIYFYVWSCFHDSIEEKITNERDKNKNGVQLNGCGDQPWTSLGDVSELLN